MQIKAVIVDKVPKSVSECSFAENKYEFKIQYIKDGEWVESITFTCAYLNNKENGMSKYRYLENRCVSCPLMNHSQYILRYGVTLREEDFELIKEGA